MLLCQSKRRKEHSCLTFTGVCRQLKWHELEVMEAIWALYTVYTVHIGYRMLHKSKSYFPILCKL